LLLFSSAGFAMPHQKLNFSFHLSMHSNERPEVRQFYEMAGRLMLSWGTTEGMVADLLSVISRQPGMKHHFGRVGEPPRSFDRKRVAFLSAYRSAPWLKEKHRLAAAIMKRMDPPRMTREYLCHGLWQGFDKLQHPSLTVLCYKTGAAQNQFVKRKISLKRLVEHINELHYANLWLMSLRVFTSNQIASLNRHSSD
jgi:hypothetical protein